MMPCLNDIRVLEMGQVLAAPFAGMILGDLGAEVIKVEPPRGDSARQTPPHFYKGESIYFMTLNRNKKSVVLDLTQEAGRCIFYDLVRKSDVVLDNLRPGVAEKLGIQPEELARCNPAVISCSINGYGARTPEAHKPAFDLMIQARGGGMSLTGTPGGPPVRMGVSISDHVAAIYAVTGVLAALHERQRTGRGQHVEVPLLSTMISLLSYEAGFYLYSGEVPGPVGSGHRSLMPYNAVTAADGHLVVDAHLPKFWSALCRVLERPDLAADSRFESLDARNRNRQELLTILDSIFAHRPRREWIQALEAAGVPCAPIQNVQEALSDPATRALNMVSEIHHTGVDLHFRTPGNPISFSGSPQKTHESPPLLGEHTDSVLTELLGYEREHLERLKKERVIIA